MALLAALVCVAAVLVAVRVLAPSDGPAEGRRAEPGDSTLLSRGVPV